MIYTFDTTLAKKYGLEEAIMIQNFQYWIIKNKVNNKNFYDNHYWTYNSKNALQQLFSFWTYAQVKRILQSLINQGVLIKGNYNKSPYDKTLWYAFNDEEYFLKLDGVQPCTDSTEEDSIEPSNKNEITVDTKQNNVSEEQKNKSCYNTYEKNLKFLKYSERLQKYVESRKKKSINKKTIDNWNNTFRLLAKDLSAFRNEEEIEQSINKVFDYLENENDSQGQYKFVVESADSFREKFTKIEDKITRKETYRQEYTPCLKNKINYAEMEKHIL